MKAHIYLTDSSGTLQENVIPLVADDERENEVLNIYAGISDQTLEGFGGALTDAAGYVFSHLSPEQRETLLTMYFDPEYMGYNQVRIPIDSCDFSTHLYEADPDETDKSFSRFSFSDTERYILPLLDAAEEKAGKKMNIMLSAWSPPSYMKTNGSRVQGGKLKDTHQQAWADYICRYITEFKNRGYHVARLTVQNEPHAAQRWDSCLFTAQDEKLFLRDALIPALEKNGLSGVECFVWDHNKERLYERAQGTIDATTEHYIAGLAFHWYSGSHFEALDLTRRAFPDKKLILSENAIEFLKYGRDGQLENAEAMVHDLIGNLNHGACGIYDWNILLDSDGGPNHANNLCEAPYMYDMSAGELEERRCLRYYWHLAHFIRPGAVRLGSTRYTEQLDFTAWRNLDGIISFVTVNRTNEPLGCCYRFKGKLFQVAAPPHSIMSGILEE